MTREQYEAQALGHVAARVLSQPPSPQLDAAILATLPDRPSRDDAIDAICVLLQTMKSRDQRPIRVEIHGVPSQAWNLSDADEVGSTGPGVLFKKLTAWARTFRPGTLQIAQAEVELVLYHDPKAKE